MIALKIPDIRATGHSIPGDWTVDVVLADRDVSHADLPRRLPPIDEALAPP